MIGFLNGQVIDKSLQEVWLDVRGVGYRVKVGTTLLDSLTRGQEASLYIHTNVRETAIELFGFADRASLNVFELLLDVSGIGPKIALAITATQSPEAIRSAVMKADVTFFKAIPGIGTKGAQRIIVDLKNKVGSIADLDLASDAGSELEQALVQFGFKSTDIRTVLPKIDTSLSLEEQIKAGIKLLGRK